MDFSKIMEEAEKAKTILGGLVAIVNDDGEGWGSLTLNGANVWAFEDIEEAHRMRDEINEALKPVRVLVRQQSEEALRRMAMGSSRQIEQDQDVI